KVDLPAIEKWFIDTIKASGAATAEDLTSFEGEIHKDWGYAAKWLNDFHTAGGGVMMVSLGDNVNGPDAGPAVIVPIAQGANTQQLLSMFINGNLNGSTTRPKR